MKSLSLIPVLGLSLVFAVFSCAFAGEDVFSESAAATQAMAGVEADASVAAPAAVPAATLVAPVGTSADHIVGIVFCLVFCLGVAWWVHHLNREDALDHAFDHTLQSHAA